MAERKVGSVTYQEVGEEYFKERGLRRHAGVWSLWALGVAAVISGDFFGWNLGLLSGEFGGLAIATVFITIMYIGLCYSISEMSPALPHTGGAYSFGRSAMGPWGGFITGLAENMEYVVTPAVVVVAIGFYMNTITIELFDLDIPLQIWWLIAFAIFVGLNIAGIETTMRFTVVVCVLSLGILLFFFVAALTDFSVDHLTNIPPEPGNSKWLPFGVEGIFKNLPFAIWFYLAIEELPLAAEESMDPRRDIPRATMWGLWALVFFGVGISGKAIIIFVLAVFPFIFNAQAGVRAVDPLRVVRVGVQRRAHADQYRSSWHESALRSSQPHRHRFAGDRSDCL